ncbi:MAG: hypothetical protein ACI9HI_000773 [Salinirussus sp.]|jgi:hypothetical protein
MFEQFSRGYYLGRLYVEPGEGDPGMCHRQHAQVTEHLYDTNVPPVMKLGRTHFAVGGETGVPADTLALPPELLEGEGVTNPPTLTEVFLAKGDRAAQLLSLADSRAV